MRVCLRCGAELPSRWACTTCGWQAECAQGIPLLAPELAAAIGDFDSAFFADLVQLESGNFWFRARNRLLIWALNRYFPSADSMLEIGCGTGFVLAAVRDARPQLHLFGSEVLVDGLVHSARHLRNVELLQMDGRKMPFKSEFDVIGAFDVLEHVDDDQQVLTEAHRALTPDGGLLLTVPQHPFLWSASDDYAHHKRRYSRVVLRQRVERAGFRIVRCSSFVTLLMPLLMTSRWSKRKLEDFNPRAEFEIPSTVNWILERLLGLERTLIQSGVDLPFGGSLLLVARKA